MSDNLQTDVDNKLSPESQKTLSTIIEGVLSEYDKESKFYTADTLHYLRSKITHLAKEQLPNEIVNVDVILDLRHTKDIRFGFKVNIPLINKPQASSVDNPETESTFT